MISSSLSLCVRVCVCVCVCLCVSLCVCVCLCFAISQFETSAGTADPWHTVAVLFPGSTLASSVPALRSSFGSTVSTS
eukprot:SAG25_NODE_648_length_6205_cov_2.314609_5_plen_78_part_00